MKMTRLWIVLAALAATMLACSVLSGGAAPTATPAGSVSEPTQDADVVSPTEEAPVVTEEAPVDEPTADTGGNSHNTEFPLPDDVSNFMELGGDLITFQTKMSLTDLLAFYQDSLAKEGYTERKILTVTSDTTFNLVFDGHESGKAIVVQGVDLGGGTSNISITLQKLD